MALTDLTERLTLRVLTSCGSASTFRKFLSKVDNIGDHWLKNTTVMNKPFRLTFAQGHTAKAVRVRDPAILADALERIGLQPSRPILVVVGGASQMSETDFHRLQKLFLEVLAPIAEKLGAYVVDGGTDAGVMQLMGRARSLIAATFPLIGVAPDGKVALPNYNEVPGDSTPLEPHHTHFVLIPGSKWGEESPWIVRVATVLAAEKPSVTVLLNGGEVTYLDARYSVIVERLVIVVAGSGRMADQLAAAVRGEAADERVQELANSGLVKEVNLHKGFEDLATVIERTLSTNKD